MNKEQLRNTANAMVQKGKGILAADESNPTCGKRFDGIGVASTEMNRNTYRDLLFTTTGMEEFISGVILFDEMDAADPNTMLIANQMLANGFMFLAQRHEKPEVHRGENVVILSAMNTFGNGADMLYAGRNQQDGATMDRFEFVEMPHDKTLEAKITPDEALTEWASKIRKNIKKFKLNKNLSTRRLVRYRNLMAANKTLGYLENKFFIGWSADERKKALTEVE